MTHRRVALVTALLLILPRLAQAQQQKVLTKNAPTTQEAAAIAREQQVLRAVVHGDVAGMKDALGNPHILMVGSDGISIWTPEGVEAFMKVCTTTSQTPSDFRSVIAGKDVIVLAYKSEGDQVCQGRRSPSYTNALSVWQRKGGRWSLLAHSETAPAAAASDGVPTSVHPFQGACLYLPPLKGMAVYSGNRFDFLLGPADGGGNMTSTAGTYEMMGDTAVGTVLFSTAGGAQPGSRFRWLVHSLPGDTVAYTLIDSAGRSIGSGRTLRLRE